MGRDRPETASLRLSHLLPPLSQEEYEALKADIAERGVLVPVEYDEDGNILDGYHRVRACQELGIKDWPRIVRVGLTEEEKIEHALSLNLNRRQLTREQKQEIAKQLRERGWSQRRIARVLGVTQPTIHNWLKDKGDKDLSPEKVEGADGKLYPARKKRRSAVFAATEREHERVQEALEKTRENLPGKILTAQRLARIARETIAQEAETGEFPTAKEGDIEIRLGDFRDVLGDLEGEVDAIITDPPYGKEYLNLYSDLSRVAATLLKPSGVLVVMVGTLHLPDYLARLMTHLRYRWTCAYIAQGPRTRVFPARVGTGWKPLLVFTRQDAADTKFLNDDVFYAATLAQDGTGKVRHPWEQSVAGFAEIVKRFTNPGDLVVDPFLGSGTTAVACRDLGRRFVGCDIDPKAVAIAKERLA
ncbi:MAG: hypothetical protein DRJ03_05330 [Chloroflexi bacterium]|nr:MAG: hypothetical protein DRJ03_05330 [Chloroflexota bacterium]